MGNRGKAAGRFGLRTAPFVGFVPVRDLAVARDFYVGVLGLSMVDENPAAVVVESAGTTLRLTVVGELRPQPFTIAGWGVPDIHRAVASLVVGRRDLHALRRAESG